VIGAKEAERGEREPAAAAATVNLALWRCRNCSAAATAAKSAARPPAYPSQPHDLLLAGRPSAQLRQNPSGHLPALGRAALLPCGQERYSCQGLADFAAMVATSFALIPADRKRPAMAVLRRGPVIGRPVKVTNLPGSWISSSCGCLRPWTAWSLSRFRRARVWPAPSSADQQQALRPLPAKEPAAQCTRGGAAVPATGLGTAIGVLGQSG